ncbi:MAG: type II toxin-antitoxin system HicA family toxin [Thermodesulfobacteriota bacterium]|nr:type II toxin-antitoxin system HicA family toxin [Thermodesulfobacteriota bacterium]
MTATRDKGSMLRFGYEGIWPLTMAPLYSTIAIVNRRQRRTLAAIFEKPVPADMEWRAVASLIKALGGTIRYGDGSRVRIDLKGESVNIHSPHPQKELKRYAVRLIRELLIRTGDRP